MPLTRRTTVLLIASALLPGCLSAQPSLIETGKPVDTGKRPFDTYFKEVGELRDKVERLDSDLFPLRQPLTTELNVDEDTSMTALLDETRTRVGKLRDYGISLNLQLTPEPRMILHQGELEQDDKDASLPPAIQESAVRAMSTFKQYQEMLELAASLEQRRAKLADKIDQLPPNFTKRSMVEENIVGAGRVLTKIENKLLRDTRTIGHFLLGLAAVSDTGAREGYDTKCDEAVAFLEEDKKKKSKRNRWANRYRGKARPRPRGKARPRPRARPAPPAPPPPTRPASGGDFEM